MGPTEYEFPIGMPGFPDNHRYTLAIVDEGPLHHLTALERGGPRFFVVEPPAILEPRDSYSVRIETWVVDMLGLSSPSEARVFVVLNTRSLQVTANLLGPIVLNPALHLGCQVVADGYPVRAPLAREVSCSS